MLCIFFFFKQKTAYEMRISDWSSDVCSSDLRLFLEGMEAADAQGPGIDRPGAPGPQLDRRIDRRRGVLVDPLALQAGQEVGPAPGDDGVDLVGDVFLDADVEEIGRASCRESGCKYVSISVVAVALKKK